MPSARVHGISSAFWATVNVAVVIWGITEKIRWTPFKQDMQCDVSPPKPMRLSGLSVPSPYAEGMGMEPGTPPFGLHLNMTTSSSCTNPGQTSITMKADSSETLMLAPTNTTDLALGGVGLPFATMGRAKMQQDVHFAAGGGQGKIVTVTQIQQPLELVLAGMSPASQIEGYSKSFVRNIQTVETCFTLLGMQTCTEITSEQFCGSFGGSCLAERLDATGAPQVPAQFEPAICGYTSSLCGKEEDVLAQLKPEALGIEIITKIPCPAAHGLPDGTECNVVRAPGLDAVTRLPKTVEPQMVLTPEAQAEQAKALAEAEGMLNSMIMGTIIANSCFFALNVFMSCFCCRRARRERLAREKANAPVIVAVESFHGTWQYFKDTSAFKLIFRDGGLFFEGQADGESVCGQLAEADIWRDETKLMTKAGEHWGALRVQQRSGPHISFNFKKGDSEAWGPECLATKVDEARAAKLDELPHILGQNEIEQGKDAAGNAYDSVTVDC
eukprot:TRINITY_DN1562_c0_g1_i2.p1 TRINITY_DN1562_c0_g1~~TRINITY_DN1562_c0_g1_i2.p1  ORF type:complete len:499 (+),score=108.18 TRINITY_DN1562_c0_g1_i2:62-1558(+)